MSATSVSIHAPDRLFLNGTWQPSSGNQKLSVISPVTEEEILTFPDGTPADMDKAVASARAAFDLGPWPRMSPQERGDMLLKVSAILTRRFPEIVSAWTTQVGAPIALTQYASKQVPGLFEFYGKMIQTYPLVEERKRDDGRIARIVREPAGVVAAITPWNAPMILLCYKVAAGLAAGCTIVSKPAPETPMDAYLLAECIEEAGLPEGVFNVVPGLGETAGQALGRHMDVDCIAFTGSGEVGKYFLKYSGESNMKQVWLECGGKSPNIVLGDAPDLDVAAQRTAFGIWFNQGEVCTAGSRLIVEDKIKDEFLAKVMAIGQKMMPGDPLDPKTQMGAMVDETQTRRVMGYIDAGQKEGAKLAMGGKQVHVDNAGSFIEPTVFDNVDNKMKIAQEEIFGPVLSVIPVKDAEQALTVANDTIYGLASAIFTADINKAFKFAKGLRTGSVWVNTYDGGDITTPFGGYKQSGNGRDKSLHAFDKFTQIKTTWIQLD